MFTDCGLDVEMLLFPGASKPVMLSKCEKCEDTEGEPVYQGILEVTANTKLGENTEISSLKVRERERERERGGVDVVIKKCKD